MVRFWAVFKASILKFIEKTITAIKIVVSVVQKWYWDK